MKKNEKKKEKKTVGIFCEDQDSTDMKKVEKRRNRELGLPVSISKTEDPEKEREGREGKRRKEGKMRRKDGFLFKCLPMIRMIRRFCITTRAEMSPNGSTRRGIIGHGLKDGFKT